jgi:hypothetical protein
VAVGVLQSVADMALFFEDTYESDGQCCLFMGIRSMCLFCPWTCFVCVFHFRWLVFPVLFFFVALLAGLGNGQFCIIFFVERHITTHRLERAGKNCEDVTAAPSRAAEEFLCMSGNE